MQGRCLAPALSHSCENCKCVAGAISTAALVRSAPWQSSPSQFFFHLKSLDLGLLLSPVSLAAVVTGQVTLNKFVYQLKLQKDTVKTAHLPLSGPC